MKFVLYLTPKRSDLLSTMTDREKATVGAHFQYLKARLDEGKLYFAGRRTDAAFGIAVFEAESETEARRFVDADPAVKGGIFDVTVGQFQYALSTDPGLLG